MKGHYRLCRERASDNPASFSVSLVICPGAVRWWQAKVAILRIGRFFGLEPANGLFSVSIKAISMVSETSS